MSIDRKSFYSLSYGVHIVSASDGKKKYGSTVNTLLQLTSNPFQLSVTLNKENATTGLIMETGRFNAVVLDETAPVDLIGRFGFRSSTEIDKFEGWKTNVNAMGIPYVSEYVAASFSLKVIHTLDVGTHYLFVGEVEEALKLSDEKPMTYAYYRQVKGGKTPSTASSFVPDNPSSGQVETNADSFMEQVKDTNAVAAAADISSDSTVENDAIFESEHTKKMESNASRGVKLDYAWRCTVCGYIENIDELPDGYTCPVCGVSKDFFERIEV